MHACMKHARTKDNNTQTANTKTDNTNQQWHRKKRLFKKVFVIKLLRHDHTLSGICVQLQVAHKLDGGGGLRAQRVLDKKKPESGGDTSFSY